MSFDSQLFPRTAAYVAALPGGLDAYPRCRVRTAVTKESTLEFPQVLEHPGIEPEMRARIKASMNQGEWMPETIGTAVRLLIRDVVFDNDQDYFEWYFRVAEKLFTKPLFKVLMYVVSPTLVMLGASKRWSAFREGSAMTAKVEQGKAVIELKFPENLYPEIALVGLGEVIRASVTAARARNVESRLVEATSTRAEWLITWQ
jgi:hypothetical protein